MAACPVSVTPPSSSRRRRLVLTQRRIDANRRNARRSTGPRTREGKARVATMPSSTASSPQWNDGRQTSSATSPTPSSDFVTTSGQLPRSRKHWSRRSRIRMCGWRRCCVTKVSPRYEYHQQRDREIDARIAAANPTEAARLHEYRETQRRAGLWKPTIPGERDGNTILRLIGRLERDISYATSRLRERKVQKQTHFGSQDAPRTEHKIAKTNPLVSSAESAIKEDESGESSIFSDHESEKTNPLSSMFQGNRHERRRAKALLRRRE